MQFGDDGDSTASNSYSVGVKNIIPKTVHPNNSLDNLNSKQF